jgi:hypothetical protein
MAYIKTGPFAEAGFSKRPLGARVNIVAAIKEN